MGVSLAWRGRLGWRDEVVTALDQWIALEGGGGRSPQWRRVGAARSTAEPGIFVVDIQGSDLSADQLNELCLAGAEPDSVKAGFRAMDATVEGRLLRIRVAEFAAPPDPHIWILRHPSDFLLTALRDGIAGLTDGGLANLSSGRPAPSQMRGGHFARRSCSTSTRQAGGVSSPVPKPLTMAAAVARPAMSRLRSSSSNSKTFRKASP